MQNIAISKPGEEPALYFVHQVLTSKNSYDEDITPNKVALVMCPVFEKIFPLCKLNYFLSNGMNLFVYAHTRLPVLNLALNLLASGNEKVLFVMVSLTRDKSHVIRLGSLNNYRAGRNISSLNTQNNG